MARTVQDISDCWQCTYCKEWIYYKGYDEHFNNHYSQLYIEAIKKVALL